jgi:hypothetical protein
MSSGSVVRRAALLRPVRHHLLDIDSELPEMNGEALVKLRLLHIRRASYDAMCQPRTWLKPQLTAAIVPAISGFGTFETCPPILRMSVHRVPAQPVDATQALNLSAGVSNCKVSRGRSFS